MRINPPKQSWPVRTTPLSRPMDARGILSYRRIYLPNHRKELFQVVVQHDHQLLADHRSVLEMDDRSTESTLGVYSEQGFESIEHTSDRRSALSLDSFLKLITYIKISRRPRLYKLYA